jgi:hypothetical protein
VIQIKEVWLSFFNGNKKNNKKNIIFAFNEL